MSEEDREEIAEECYATACEVVGSINSPEFDDYLEQLLVASGYYD